MSSGQRLFLLIALISTPIVTAEPVAAPGDGQLRDDLQLLNDSGLINVPLTAWPVAYGDVQAALQNVPVDALGIEQGLAHRRLMQRLGWELETHSVDIVLGVSGAEKPRLIRSFENTPREDAEVSGRLVWIGERFALNVSATFVADPIDGDEIRPDGSYVGVALGNWMVMAGWQDRWYGPGRDGSLILSNNARPSPGLTVQRISSTPFNSKWLRWVGPWTLSGFVSELDDERSTKNALLLGMRVSFRPAPGLEVGFSRTAQWCGDGRPCDADTLLKLLLGKDNRGINVDPASEPGNQLGGFDVRWSLPRQVPLAFYIQWIGEDGRPNGGIVGSWLRQFGLEHWGQVRDISHRTHFEVSDTTCRQGGFGFADRKPNCAYEHPLYVTGYRYNGRPIGHSTDADSLSYSVGSTLIQSGGHTWNATIRYMEINRFGIPDGRHTLSPTPLQITDVLLTHDRLTQVGRFYLGLGYSRSEDEISGDSQNFLTAFLRWSSR